MIIEKARFIPLGEKVLREPDLPNPVAVFAERR
jgi:hypothetical protein